MIACTIWADDRILAAADGISDDQYGQLRAQLEHMLGTQRYWYANWTAGTLEQPALARLADAQAGYAASHDALRSYAVALTDGEWHRAEQWWKAYGFDARMALGESITQVFYHGVQHRSEVAVLLSMWGRSPGDMDYLTFLRESGAPQPSD
jgi:uncharacterized damage-inducible protein DinB